MRRLDDGLQDAIAAGSFHTRGVEICRGDVSAALGSAEHTLEGGIHIGGQEHFYLETQACLVVPKGEHGEIEIFSATQDASAVQVLLTIN